MVMPRLASLLTMVTLLASSELSVVALTSTLSPAFNVAPEATFVVLVVRVLA